MKKLITILVAFFLFENIDAQITIGITQHNAMQTALTKTTVGGITSNYFLVPSAAIPTTGDWEMILAGLSATASQTDVTCNALCDGTATVIASGGIAPYSYAWAPSGGTGSTASSLCAGNYTCTITDAASATLSVTFLITEPVVLNGVRTRTNVTCFGANDGTATIAPSGGTPPYTYLWSPLGGTAATAINLPAGAYTVTVTDANSCNVQKTYLITQPTPMNSTPSQIDISCFGGNDGAATAIGFGGVGPYTYSWAPTGGTASTASALVAGDYTCTITDVNSCTFAQQFTLTEPAVLSDIPSQTDITCNGSGNGTATVSISGGTGPYTYLWSPSGGTLATETALAAGSYTCAVTDANACTLSETFTITQPTILSATTSQINNTCSGGNSGSATVVVSGGTAPYTYAWTPSGGTAATASLLTSGTYTCTIIDANGCSLVKIFTITEPSGISIILSQTNTSCFGGSDGSATVAASGGTPTYTYSWAPSGGNAATANSLSAGNYTCTITDASSCFVSATFTITSPPAITFTSSQTNVTCNSLNDGTASVVASGGSPGYTYNWLPSGGTAATEASLAPGNYTCTITDLTSCSVNATFTITQPTSITSTNSQTNVSCNSGNNGTATVVPAGGTPTYTYLWAPSGGTLATASGLTSGNYTCTITDANSCSATATFNITQPLAITSVSSQTNVTCNGGSNGTATVVASGGTPGYTYSWAPAGGTAATASGLTAGNYTCTITDANACSITATFNITQAAAITSVNSQTNPNCSGGNTGSATVVASGGTPTYTYSWTPSGGTAATASGLAAGNYTCTITDANSCIITSTFLLVAPTAITSTNSQANISCNGGSNGSASVIASGGNPGYTYSWAPTGGTASTASSLSVGTYTCTITDATACSITATFNITQPPALVVSSLSQTNISCNAANNGAASVSVVGGTLPYVYDWTPGSPTGDGTPSVSALSVGLWTCAVTDANGCTSFQSFNITQPTALIVSVLAQTNISCNGGSNGAASVLVSGATPAYSYNWTPGNPTGDGTASVTGLTPGTWTCTVTDANGCIQTQTYLITQPAVLAATPVLLTNVTCFGGSNGVAQVLASGGTGPFTYAWLPTGGTAVTASGLIAGIYTCTITDANSCTATATFNITQPPSITSTNSQTNVSCNSGNNGTATVVPAGGTPAYTYLWAPSGGTLATASGLTSGNYTCTITDANFCSATATFNITQPLAITSVSSQTNVTCNGGSNGTATVVASGGTPGYTYSWAPAGGTAATASGLTAGNYTCTITDANACSITATFNITQASAITSVNSQTNPNCSGGNTGSATVVASGGTPSYTYSWSPSGGTAATASGLAAGNYTCTITDANSCIITSTFLLVAPTAITSTNSQANISCNGGSNGSASVIVSGGNPGYTYSWAPTGGTASTASSLSVGTYTCTITDATACSITATFNITQPAPITSTNSQTNVTCNGGLSGTATVLPSAGTAPYSFSWSPSGGFLATASGLAAGTYTCTITDANSCTSTQTFTITQPTLISATTSQINVTCNGGTNGNGTVVASGGTPGYTYNWSPSGGTASTSTLVGAGNYTCTITDANSCSINKTFTITQPPAIILTAASQTNISCNGGSNGTATVNAATGGTAPYSYNWTPGNPTGDGTVSVSGLAIGTWTCTVTDANSCTTTQTFNITQPPVITITPITQINVSCNGGSNGSALVSASGGTGVLSYNWTPGNPTGDGTASVTGLTAGSWTCTVTDINLCSASATFTITQPTPLVVSSLSQLNVTCNGGSNGAAAVTVSGGTAAYSYNWTPGNPTGDGTSSVSNLIAGTWTCTVTDANTCTATQTFTITQPPAIILAIASQTNITCNGGSNGAASVVPATGGTAPYSYNWTPGNPTGDGTVSVTGLTAGSWTCTVTDANTCSTSTTFTITQPPIISVTPLSQTNVSCNGGSNGAASVSASGGTGVLSYNWTPGNPTGDGTASVTGLTPGTWTCTVTDANSCVNSATFNITQPLPIVLSVAGQTNVSCNGGSNGTATVNAATGGAAPYAYNWTPGNPTGDGTVSASGLTAGSWTCTVTDANTCSTSTTFTITQPPAIIVTPLSQTNISCNGGNNGAASVAASGGTGVLSYNWTPGNPTGDGTASVTGLLPGTWTCTVTDANGCSITQTFNITQPPILVATSSQINATCFGGSNGQATAIVSGGTSAYSYLWLPSGGTGITATNLSAGTYTCQITDANACTISVTVIITQPPTISVAASQVNVLCFGGTNGSATVTATGGTPGYTYLWTPSGQTSPSATNLSAGTYTCTITDANLCTISQAFNITQPNALTFTMSSSNVVCHGGSDGTAHISVIGGTIGYSFNWLPTGGTDSIATNLPAGSYTCNVVDANGCSITATVNILEPSQIFVTQLHSNVTCFGSTDGTATVTPSGGVAPYTYAWSPSGGTAAVATGLTAGSYTCLITDASGCSFSQLFNIASPTMLTATTTQLNVSCNGGSNGTATITVNGGSPFYSYNWLPSGGTGATASGLSAGTYTCNITDANSCTMTQTVLITEPTFLAATISSTNTNCSQSNGTATLVASGGTAPYLYSWAPSGGNAATANSILAGTYTCTLTDLRGCSNTYTVVVNDTPAPTVSLVSQTNILCNGGNNGDATILTSGGAGTLTYAWSPSGGTSASANNLVSGSYTCTVTDSAGCTATQSVSIIQPALLTASSTSGSILCNGGSTTVNVVASGGVAPYLGDGSFTDTANTYSYIVTDANGCATTTTIIVTEPTLIVVNAIPASILCNGASATVLVNATGGTASYTGTGSFVEVAGTYNYPITDANGCMDSASVTLTEPSVLVVSSSATSIICNGGNATVTVLASGGTSAYTGIGTFTQIAGTQSYIVTDANGCVDSTSITITQPTLLVTVIDSIQNPTGCNATDGMIYISVSGGTAGYSYLWTNTTTIEDLAGVNAGTYSCTITDSNGCINTINSTLTDPLPPVVSVLIDTVLCAQNGPYTLTEGNPIGGVWSGTSISGNAFDPAAAGIGSYLLTYTYTAPNGCVGIGSDTMVVDACIGIENNGNETVWSAYPNPTFGNVMLSTNGTENENHLVEVYSTEGKLILAERFSAGQSIQFNLTNEAAGIYMVRITSSSKISTVRIIKQ